MTYEPAVAASDYPAGANDAEMLRFFVNFAILAPSGHNTQPWLFKIRKQRLDLLADRTRALVVVDPHDRELAISCGAALELSWWHRAALVGTWRSTNCRAPAVLGTKGDAPGDWLATGRALSRVLLKLTASGATAAFLNQPIEVERLRPRLQHAIGTTGVPQLLMRFGYAESVKQSVRRPVEDVLI